MRLPWLLKQRDKWSERVSVHAVSITVGGQAEGAVRELAASVTIEKTADVAGNLVSGDGDVLEDTFLCRVVVGTEDSDGELCQHVPLGMKKGVDAEDGQAGGDNADFGLLGVH